MHGSLVDTPRSLHHPIARPKSLPECSRCAHIVPTWQRHVRARLPGSAKWPCRRHRRALATQPGSPGIRDAHWLTGFAARGTGRLIHNIISAMSAATSGRAGVGAAALALCSGINSAAGGMCVNEDQLAMSIRMTVLLARFTAGLTSMINNATTNNYGDSGPRDNVIFNPSEGVMAVTGSPRTSCARIW